MFAVRLLFRSNLMLDASLGGLLGFESTTGLFFVSRNNQYFSNAFFQGLYLPSCNVATVESF